MVTGCTDGIGKSYAKQVNEWNEPFPHTCQYPPSLGCCYTDEKYHSAVRTLTDLREAALPKWWANPVLDLGLFGCLVLYPGPALSSPSRPVLSSPPPPPPPAKKNKITKTNNFVHHPPLGKPIVRKAKLRIDQYQSTKWSTGRNEGPIQYIGPITLRPVLLHDVPIRAILSLQFNNGRWWYSTIFLTNEVSNVIYNCLLYT